MAKAAVPRGVLPGGVPFVATGAGPPLLVLAGLMPEAGIPRGITWVSARATIQPFAHRRTAYWVNRRRGLEPGTTIADLARELAHAIDGAFRGPVDVVGISTGGSLALQLALDHPGTVRRLVVASAAARLDGEGSRSQREAADVARAGDRRAVYRLLAREVLPEGSSFERVIGGFLWLAGPLLFPAAGDLSDLVVQVDAEDGFDVRDRAPAIASPTLIVGGGRDRFYAVEEFRETAALIPGARLIVYDRRGHVTALSDPRFARDVLAFLDAEPPGP